MKMPIEATENLFGAVKKIESKTFSLIEEDGESRERFDWESRSLYDETRNLLELSYLYPGNHSNKTVNLFDDRKRLVEQKVYRRDALAWKIEIVYNDRDLVAERRIFDYEFGTENTVLPVYTENGLQIEDLVDAPSHTGTGWYLKVVGPINFAVAPDVDVSFSDRMVYRQRKTSTIDGHLISVEFYNGWNGLEGKILVHYDGERAIGVDVYGDDRRVPYGFVAGWSIYLYILFYRLFHLYVLLSTIYRLVTRAQFRKGLNCFFYGAPLDETFVEYDEEQRVVEINHRSTFPATSGKKVFKYDAMGNKTEESVYSNGDILNQRQTHEYDYDAQNNWVQRKTVYRHFSGQENEETTATILTKRIVSYY